MKANIHSQPAAAGVILAARQASDKASHAREVDATNSGLNP